MARCFGLPSLASQVHSSPVGVTLFAKSTRSSWEKTVCAYALPTNQLPLPGACQVSFRDTPAFTSCLSGRVLTEGLASSHGYVEGSDESDLLRSKRRRRSYRTPSRHRIKSSRHDSAREDEGRGAPSLTAESVIGEGVEVRKDEDGGASIGGRAGDGALTVVAEGGSSDGAESGADEAAEPGKTAKFQLPMPRRRVQLTFTCDACGGRTSRMVNPHALAKGTVYVQCAQCEVFHQLVDNLGLVVEYDFRKEAELERLLALEQGEGTDGTDGTQL
eukprot:TRINITY_DN16831_c0_g1_i1.p1 TRINITY_DN16831_c0_g1~~TRINITY_DN16831_c0_g1_i1.p1  ORF type:complete len:274 (-),score=42.42 TRINITY_DN16831_c0_g1_i1:1149-1970(-)